MSTVAIAGASGFVGRRLIDGLSDHNIVALYRSHKPEVNNPNVEWRSCDLFSLKQTMKALEGVDTAIYLVHSMLPASRLFQGNFQDTDLIIADNFARAAQKAGVKRIIYLGGLSQNQEKSEHLKSRYEVEKTFEASGIPLTTLRAGIVIGENGSSFLMIETLVRRLPIMVCPRWTETKTEAVAVDDVIVAFRYCLSHSETENRHYDLGSGEAISYRELIQMVADALQVNRLFVHIPFLTPRLSSFWIHLISGASIQLISPLVQSLKKPMLAKDDDRLPILRTQATPIFDAIKKAVQHNTEKISRTRPLKNFFAVRKQSEVRSVQRLTLPVGRDAEWVAREYMRWLPYFFKTIVQIDTDDKSFVNFRLAGTKIVLLKLKYLEDYSPKGRFLYQIVGGALTCVRKEAADTLANPRLEFREIGAVNCVIAGIHNYRPRLPWFVYKFSQALVHLWVMKSFEKHLRSL